MMPKRRYVYCIVRYSPNTVTGEFVNVGVVVGNDEEGFKARSAPNLDRGRCIAPEGRLENPNYVSAVLGHAESLARDSNVSEGLLERMATSDGNFMVCTPITRPAVTLAYNLDAALDETFEMFVLGA